MPKSKQGRALFDVLGDEESDNSTILKLPPAPGEHEVRESDSVADVATIERLKIANAPDAGRLIELDHDRIRVSLTSKSAAVVFFVVLLLVVGVFEVGRRSGRDAGFSAGYRDGRASFAADAVGEIEAARAQPPSSHLVNGLLLTPAEAPETAPVAEQPSKVEGGGPQWLRGYTYIVAQEFSAEHADHVADAQAYLAQQGIAATPVRFDNGSVQLITIQGFNRRVVAQRRMADELLEKLHAAGRKYYASGGGYKLEGYFKTLTGERW